MLRDRTELSLDTNTGDIRLIDKKRNETFFIRTNIKGLNNVAWDTLVGYLYYTDCLEKYDKVVE